MLSSCRHIVKVLRGNPRPRSRQRETSSLNWQSQSVCRNSRDGYNGPCFVDIAGTPGKERWRTRQDFWEAIGGSRVLFPRVYIKSFLGPMTPGSLIKRHHTTCRQRQCFAFLDSAPPIYLVHCLESRCITLARPLAFLWS